MSKSYKFDFPSAQIFEKIRESCGLVLADAKEVKVKHCDYLLCINDK